MVSSGFQTKQSYVKKSKQPVEIIELSSSEPSSPLQQQQNTTTKPVILDDGTVGEPDTGVVEIENGNPEPLEANQAQNEEKQIPVTPIVEEIKDIKQKIEPVEQGPDTKVDDKIEESKSEAANNSEQNKSIDEDMDDDLAQVVTENNATDEQMPDNVDSK